MTDRIKNANDILQKNLFWIIPLFFFTMVAGFTHAIFQREKNDMLIIETTEAIQHQIELDTAVLPRVDSLKETLKKMK